MTKHPDFTRRVMLALAVFGALGALVSLLSLAFAGNAQPTPTPAKVARQTAQPWTGSPAEFEYHDRENTLRLSRVMDELKLKPGSRVADIGAGGGWLSVRLARRVGPKGVVYAQEILPRFTQYIQARAKREKLSNIRTVLGTVDDPKLPAKTLDAAVILNAYHEFDKPLAMLQKIRTAMKPGARLGFIERDTDELRREAEDAYAKTGQIKRRVDEKPDGNAYTDDHRLALPIVMREAKASGFTIVRSQELGDDHYLLVVEKPRR